MAATNGTVWGNKVAADWSGNFSNSTSVTYSVANGTSGILTNTSEGSKSGDFEYISFIDLAIDRDLIAIAFCVGTTAPTLAQYYMISLRSSYNAIQFYFRKDSLQYGAGGTAISSQNYTHTKGSATSTLWFKIVRSGTAIDFYVDVSTARGGTPTWVKLTGLSVASESSYTAGHFGYATLATYDSTSVNTYWFQSFTQTSSAKPELYYARRRH